MAGLAELLGLSAIMALTILISLPIVRRRDLSAMTMAVLNAVAIGILTFLLVDIYSDVAPLLASRQPYLTSGGSDLLFGLAFGGAFLVLFVLERRAPGRQELSPYATALIIAVAMGFQNLTEGLLFGSLWAGGALAGLLAVIFVGFCLQNVTEGFPIAMPLVDVKHPRLAPTLGLFLLGGLPAILGALVGFYYNSASLDLVFDGVAMGAIAYAIIPMLRVAFRPALPPHSTFRKQDMLYLGLVAGFLLGFVVNAF